MKLYRLEAVVLLGCIHSCILWKDNLCSHVKMLPVVINTWNFSNATQKAWETVYMKKGTALDAVEHGCSTCEEQQCDGSVGYGGSPDENGETTLDAMIMDGTTHDVGAVGSLRSVKSAISVARKVMEHTHHSLLVGELATDFAVSMGFKKESLSTNHSKSMWHNWKKNNCQPNYWKNVSPDPTKHCGPYKPVALHKIKQKEEVNTKHNFGKDNHDTIGMIAIDTFGNIAGGTSTNGAKFKIPGRVGDSPIAGAGAYVDKEVGGAAATGDGDVMMRFLPSFFAVENMRSGRTPSEAAAQAILRIANYYSNFSGALICVSIKGEFGASCSGMPEFSFSVCNPSMGNVQVLKIPCIKL